MPRVKVAGDPADDRPGLLAVLARVADPRHRRGVRYRLTAILGLAVCAVLASARSFTAIAEWAGDADPDTLRILTERAVVHASGSAHASSARTTTPVGARMSGGVAWAAASTWIRGGGGTRSG